MTRRSDHDLSVLWAVLTVAAICAFALVVFLAVTR